MVPGHEIAGIVTRVGGKVARFKPGDKVGVGCFVDSCRACDECRQGLEQYCSVLTSWTYNGLEQDRATPTYGGYADHIVVDEHFVLRLPDLPLDGAAPLMCAGITLYSPLKRWQTGPGKRVAILGLGGLGHMGIKLAHAMGAEVTVLSHSMKKEADARRLGADQFYATASRDNGQDSEPLLRPDRQHRLGRAGLEPVFGDAARQWDDVHRRPAARHDADRAVSLIAGGKGLAGSGMGGTRRPRRCSIFAPTQDRVGDRDDPDPEGQRSLRARGAERRALPVRDRPGDAVENWSYRSYRIHGTQMVPYRS